MILDENNETPKPRANFSKIIGVNLLIILVGTICISVIYAKDPYAPFLNNCLLITIHITVCFLISVYWFIRKQWSEGQAYLLAALVVLAVGFSSCLGAPQLLS